MTTLRHQITCFISIAALLLSGCSAVRVRHLERTTVSNDPSATLKVGAFKQFGSERFGEYVAGVTFFIYEYGQDKPFKVVVSSTKGPLVIDGLVANRFEIAFEGPGFDPISKIVRLRSGMVTHVDLDLIKAQRNKHGSDGFGRALGGAASIIGTVLLWAVIYGFFYMIAGHHGHHGYHGHH